MLNFCTLIKNHPIWVDLRVASWVESYCLEVGKVGARNLVVVWAVVKNVGRSIPVQIVITLVSYSVTYKWRDLELCNINFTLTVVVFLSWIGNKGAIVRLISNPVSVLVSVAGVSLSIAIHIVLVIVRLAWTVVQGVRNSVLVTVLRSVTRVTDAVLVSVSLILVAGVWAVVADVSQAVTVRVFLIPVWVIRTIVISGAT